MARYGAVINSVTPFNNNKRELHKNANIFSFISSFIPPLCYFNPCRCYSGGQLCT
jgi:hypothetical protein